MRPQLVIDNSYGQPPVISFMRAITASTLTADIPAVMADLLLLLEAVPAGSPSSPLSGPEKPQALGRVA
ncbi:MAG TPA: hypothetical protein VF485_09095 [Sphingomonas sp.]